MNFEQTLEGCPKSGLEYELKKVENRIQRLQTFLEIQTKHKKIILRYLQKEKKRLCCRSELFQKFQSLSKEEKKKEVEKEVNIVVNYLKENFDPKFVELKKEKKYFEICCLWDQILVDFNGNTYINSSINKNYIFHNIIELPTKIFLEEHFEAFQPWNF